MEAAALDGCGYVGGVAWRWRFDLQVSSDDGSDTSAVRLPFPRDAIKPDFSIRMTLNLTQWAAFSRALAISAERAAIALREVGAGEVLSSLK